MINITILLPNFVYRKATRYSKLRDYINETVELYCDSDKEAAKLSALYLDHKGSLPKVEESGKGIKVQVCDTSMTCIYEVWRGRDKIYAEAVYYQSVSFDLHLKHS